jgi:hypothetical protein
MLNQHNPHPSEIRPRTSGNAIQAVTSDMRAAPPAFHADPLPGGLSGY